MLQSVSAFLCLLSDEHLLTPLEPGEHVRVAEMAPAEECEKEMFVTEAYPV